MSIQIKLFFILSALLLSFTGCTEEEHNAFPSGQPNKGVLFSIGLSGVQENEWTRAMVEEKITHLWYVIADSKGDILHPVHQRLEDDFSKLTIEGLAHGRYTIAFLATTENELPSGVNNEPSAIGSEWLSNPDTQKPFGHNFFYKKVDLTIDESQKPIAIRVIMERCMARVDLVMNMTNPYHERFIKDIRIHFDAQSEAYSSFSVSGEYSSPQPMTGCDITRQRSFLSFPSTSKLSGRVSITSSRSDGSQFVRDYRFSECELAAGKMSRISIDYIHPESENGLIYIGKNDYDRYETTTMFLEKEPQEVFYNNSQRSFYVNEPLRVSISADQRLQVRLYAPTAVRNVTVLCRFTKYSNEYFEFARFEELSPFQEAYFPIPLVESQQTYRSQAGRNVTLPAMPSLSDGDISFMVRSDDPFMEKVSQIKSTWYIRFSPYSADSGHPYWRHMTPELCRHGVALALNMAFMFSHPEFEHELAKHDGLLKDDAGVAIDLEKLKTRLLTHPGLQLGHVTGVGGLGGGETYGLADYCYRDVYFDATPPDSDPHNYARMAMFHEYGHCLGYGHDSNMTYGDVWTMLCANLFVSMGKRDLLPVSSKYTIGNLPM